MYHAPDSRLSDSSINAPCVRMTPATKSPMFNPSSARSLSPPTSAARAKTVMKTATNTCSMRKPVVLMHVVPSGALYWITGPACLLEPEPIAFLNTTFPERYLCEMAPVFSLVKCSATMFSFDSAEDVISVYTAVSIVLFIVAARFGEWPYPQLIAVTMMIASINVSYYGESSPTADVLYVVTTACMSLAFALTFDVRSHTNPLFKRLSIALMMFIVGYYGLGVDMAISNSVYKARFSGSSICDQYSIFALGSDPVWNDLEIAISADDIVDQKRAMTKLTNTYHPTKCPLACRLQCNHTFQQIEDIRNILIENK